MRSKAVPLNEKLLTQIGCATHHNYVIVHTRFLLKQSIIDRIQEAYVDFRTLALDPNNSHLRDNLNPIYMSLVLIYYFVKQD